MPKERMRLTNFEFMIYSKLGPELKGEPGL